MTYYVIMSPSNNQTDYNNNIYIIEQDLSIAGDLQLL